jgi:hypothetical protein
VNQPVGFKFPDPASNEKPSSRSQTLNSADAPQVSPNPDSLTPTNPKFVTTDGKDSTGDRASSTKSGKSDKKKSSGGIFTMVGRGIGSMMTKIYPWSLAKDTGCQKEKPKKSKLGVSDVSDTEKSQGEPEDPENYHEQV